MKVETTALKSALKRVKEVLPKKHHIPALTSIICKGGEDGLRLSTSCLEVTLETSVGAKLVNGDKPKPKYSPGKSDFPGWEAMIPGEEFIKLVETIKDEFVTISPGENIVSVVAGDTSMTLPSENKGSFFFMPQAPEERGPLVNLDRFASGLARVRFATTNDDQMPTTMVIQIKMGSEITFYATDGGVIALCTIKGLALPKNTIHFYATLAPIITKIIDSEHGELIITGSKAFIKTKNSLISWQLSDTASEDISGANLDLESATEYEIPLPEFKRSLRRAMITYDDHNSSTAIQFGKDTMELKTRNIDLKSTISDKMEVIGDCDRLMGVNSAILGKILKEIPSESVIMRFDRKEFQGSIETIDGRTIDNRMFYPIKIFPSQQKENEELRYYMSVLKDNY